MNKVVGRCIIWAIFLFALTIFTDIYSFYMFREGNYPYPSVVIVFSFYSLLAGFLCLLFSIPLTRSIHSIITDLAEKKKSSEVPSWGMIYWFCAFVSASLMVMVGLIATIVLHGPNEDLYNFIHCFNCFVAMFAVLVIGFFSPMLEMAKTREKKNVNRQKKSEERLSSG